MRSNQSRVKGLWACTECESEQVEKREEMFERPDREEVEKGGWLFEK